MKKSLAFFLIVIAWSSVGRAEERDPYFCTGILCKKSLSGNCEGNYGSVTQWGTSATDACEKVRQKAESLGWDVIIDPTQDPSLSSTPVTPHYKYLCYSYDGIGRQFVGFGNYTDEGQREAIAMCQKASSDPVCSYGGCEPNPLQD